MMKQSIVPALGLATTLAACMVADPMGTPVDTVTKESGTTEPSGTSTPKTNCKPKQGGGSGSAPAALPKVDPNTLPKCACDGGNARCVPKDIIPASFAEQLAACDSGGPGLCVPDSLVASGGAAPAKCSSLGNAEGVCLSVCVPQVAQYKDLLPSAGCAADERCAPCLNPLKNNEPTGACDIGKPTAGAPAEEECEEEGTPAPPADAGGGSTPPSSAPKCPYEGPPLVDPATFPSCGDHARCVPAAAVPANLASQLAKCPTGLCAPENFVASAGNTVPKTCNSVGNAEGRCLHELIPQVAAQKDLLTKDICEAYERCTPCYDPIDGKATGACNIACDPGPKQAKTVFKDCCAGDGAPRGKCVPTTLVPASLQRYLSDDEGTCVAGQELCAPLENVRPGFTPPTCSAVSLGSFGGGVLTGNGIRYTGVCLSDCLTFSGIERLGVADGNCADGSQCVPCINPLNNQPTGAPGCPATAGR